MIAGARAVWSPPTGSRQAVFRTPSGARVVKTYVLIVTDPGRTRDVASALSGLPLVEAVSEVMGPYDIVVEILTDSLTDIPAILSDQIRTIDGIESTTSLVAFPVDGTP